MPKTVRFYHGGDEKQHGSWVAQELDYAIGYATKDGRTDAIVWYVDISEDDPFLVENETYPESPQDIAAGFKGPRNARGEKIYGNLELPSSLAGKLKPLDPQPQQIQDARKAKADEKTKAKADKKPKSADEAKKKLSSTRAVLKTPMDLQSKSKVDAPMPSDGVAPADMADKQADDLAKPLENVRTPQTNSGAADAVAKVTPPEITPSPIQPAPTPIAPAPSEQPVKKMSAQNYALDNPTVFESLVGAAKTGKTPQDMLSMLPPQVRSHKASMDYIKKLWNANSENKPIIAPAVAKVSSLAMAQPAAMQSSLDVSPLSGSASAQSDQTQPAIVPTSSQGARTEIFQQPTNTSLLLAGQVSQSGNISTGQGADDFSLSPTTSLHQPSPVTGGNLSATPAAGDASTRQANPHKRTAIASSPSHSAVTMLADIVPGVSDSGGMSESLKQSGGGHGGETWHQELLDAIHKLTEAIEKLTDQKTKGEEKTPGPQKDGSFVSSFEKAGRSPVGKAVGAGIDKAMSGGSSGEMMQTVTDVLLREVMRGAMAAL